MSTQSSDTYLIELCRGARTGHCPYALPVPESFTNTLAEVVESSGWPAFIAGSCDSHPPRHHKKFRISVAACANGCSRPHIADIGLIFSRRPAPPESCSGCGACVDACPDNALQIRTSGSPVLDTGACLSCGKCIIACPEGAMDLAGSGCRFLLGGKLGRRPRLATELPGFLQPEAVPERVGKWLDVYMAGYAPGRRFADVVERLGLQPHLHEVENNSVPADKPCRHGSETP